MILLLYGYHCFCLKINRMSLTTTMTGQSRHPEKPIANYSVVMIFRYYSENHRFLCEGYNIIIIRECTWR